MRARFVSAVVAGSMLFLLPATVGPAASQVIAVQYGGDGYGRDYDDPYRDDDPYYDRGRAGRDDDRFYDRRDDRYENDDRYDDDSQRYRPQRRDPDRFENDRQRDIVVKRLSKRDKRCLRKHSTYDPETGTYSDGRGGQRRCNG